MKEELLHCIWEHQLFRKANLKTGTGHRIRILNQGKLNPNAGPDFDNAKVFIDDMVWVGSVEIHEKASQWLKHGHQIDPAYNRTVLHVVWKDDRKTPREDETLVPTLAIAELVHPNVLDRAQRLLTDGFLQPCARHLPGLPKHIIQESFEISLQRRLQRKSDEVFRCLVVANYDWEELCYQLLARALGSTVNGEAMYVLAQRVPLKAIRRCGDNPQQIEALLFGVSGLLMKSKHQNSSQLQHEFAFLGIKFGLENSVMSLNWWKFSRLRPANFPTIRIAQLAALLAKQDHLFELLTGDNIKSLKHELSLANEADWLKGYKSEGSSKKHSNAIGIQTVESIIRNVSVPLLVAFGEFVNNQAYAKKSHALLSELGAEDNRITREWRRSGITLKGSTASQGAIELFNQDCLNKKCLSCSIGQHIIKMPCS
jgi:hypothetical protein